MDTPKATGNSSKRKQNGYSSAKLHAKRNRKRKEKKLKKVFDFSKQIV